MYDGIKEGYPKLSDKISAYVQLTRPFTIVAPVILAFLVMAVEELYHGNTIISSSLLFVSILAGVSMGLLQLVGQVSNQICDGPEYDKKAGKGYRPIPKGTVGIGEAWSIVFLSLILSLMIGFYINFTYGLFMSLLLFFAIFNNLEPIRVKKRYIWNEVWLGLSRGFLPPVAFWAVLNGIEPIAIWIGVVAGLYVTATNWVKDITDYKADTEYDVTTLVVAFEKDIKEISRKMVYLTIVMIVIILYLITNYGIEFISLIIFVAFALTILYKTSTGEVEKTKKMENSHVWILFYLGLVAGYLGLFLVFRLQEFFFSLLA